MARELNQSDPLSAAEREFQESAKDIDDIERYLYVLIRSGNTAEAILFLEETNSEWLNQKKATAAFVAMRKRMAEILGVSFSKGATRTRERQREQKKADQITAGITELINNISKKNLQKLYDLLTKGSDLERSIVKDKTSWMRSAVNEQRSADIMAFFLKTFKAKPDREWIQAALVEPLAKLMPTKKDYSLSWLADKENKEQQTEKETETHEEWEKRAKETFQKLISTEDEQYLFDLQQKISEGENGYRAGAVPYRYQWEHALEEKALVVFRRLVHIDTSKAAFFLKLAYEYLEHHSTASKSLLRNAEKILEESDLFRERGIQRWHALSEKSCAWIAEKFPEFWKRLEEQKAYHQQQQQSYDNWMEEMGDWMEKLMKSDKSKK